MISSQATDSNFGGGPDIVPDQKGKGFTKFPLVDIRPYNLRLNTLKLEYLSKWYAQQKDLSRFINPKRGFFEGYVPNWNAQIDYKLIMDSDPAYFADVLAAGMTSGLCSRSQPWFKLGFGIPQVEEQEQVKNWLCEAERGLYHIHAESNLHDAYQGAFEELGIFSTAAFGIYEDYESVARARSFTAGEYFIGNDPTGRVNSFARTEWMTVDSIVNKFGWVNCSSVVQNAYKKGQRDIFFQVNYLCEANDNMVPGRLNYEGKKYRSIYWEAKSSTGQTLRMSGFNELPLIATRWKTVTTADTYGSGGPGWMAKGDIKSLYRVAKDLFLAVAKVGDPPVQVSAAVEGPANLIPGGQTRYSKECPDGGVKPAYQVKPDTQATMGLIQMLSRKISSRFYADLFMMMVSADNHEMTAQEVVEKQKDKLLLLGPVVGRVQTDMLGPSLRRILPIGIRAGVIPPPPPQLVGLPLNIKYIGLLAQAQKMVATAAIEQGMKFVGGLEGVFPGAKDNVDVDEAVRQYYDALGINPKILRAPDAVAQIRAAQAKAAEQQRQQEQAMAAVQGAKTLADTQVGGASALEHIMGIPGAGGQA